MHILAIAVSVILTIFMIPAMASEPGTCYIIQNADARAYCLAKAHNDSSRCYAIQDSGKRSECLAELHK